MHGIARHLINLINGLNKIAPENKYSVIISTDKALTHLGDKVDIIRSKSSFLSPLEMIEIPKIIEKIKPDLFHNPAFTPIIPKHNLPFLMTIHDMIHLTDSASLLNKLYYQFFVRRACMRADRVITVSEYSKKQISDILSIRKSHIDVVYNGIEDKYFTPTDANTFAGIKSKYRLPASYILYIGNNKPHKNVKGAVEGFLRSNVEVPLVVSLSWDEIKHYFNFKKQPDNIYCNPNIPSKDLKYVYLGASLFLSPSLKEGFGLPVIEALACGVPVVTSNVASLPEITQGGTIEVNPRDYDAIASAIKIGLYDEVLRTRNIQYGLKRAGEFTITRMAEKMLGIYEKVLNN